MLKQLYPYKENSLTEIASIFGVTENAVKNKANELGLKRRTKWSDREVERLKELAGEYPLKALVHRYNQWAAQNRLPTRHPLVIRDKLKNARVQTRLNASAAFYTSEEIAAFLGCRQDTVSHWFKLYKEELKPLPAAKTNSKLAVSRKKFKLFIINHPEIVERYRVHIDLFWLVELLTERL